MTPAARVSAAIELLDTILSGESAERTLTVWARSNRYAGSKDRAAIRDHVFDVLRCRRSLAARGGGVTGRGLMLGLLRERGIAPETLFDGSRYGPAPLTPAEIEAGREPDRLEALDCPDWLAPRLEASLDVAFEEVMRLMRRRAAVFLRVNLLRGDPAAARAALAEDGIETAPHALAATALEVTRGARRVSASRAYRDGRVELQDAASQAVVDRLPVTPADRVLDLCAGGGGKTLAVAARRPAEIHAFDAVPRRMADLPARAARAGAAPVIHDRGSLDRAGRFDLVLVDAPCSGSGTWRRDPEAKWTLDPARLERLGEMQRAVLDDAAGRVAAGGTLAYVTCSVLEEENDGRIDAFLSNAAGWHELGRTRWLPGEGGDGFFLALLRRGRG